MSLRSIFIVGIILVAVSASCNSNPDDLLLETPVESPQPTTEVLDASGQNDQNVNDQDQESISEDNSANPDSLFGNNRDELGSLNTTWCERLYTKDSIWNVPIDWGTAQIHSENTRMMAAFFESDHWIGSNTDSYAPNIYLVTNNTPFVPVQLRKNRFRDAIDDQVIVYGEEASIVQMPIPTGAVPAPGSDGQLALINLETGEEWGLNKGTIGLDGSWYADGAYRYHINNSGIPPEGFGQRGAGIGQIAGIVRECEVERGFIGHAVTIAYNYPCDPEICASNGWPAVIQPFTKTDGRGLLSADIPEGARMVVRPEIPLDEITAACKGMRGCITWVVNMQIFGGFIVDNSGHPKTYAEGTATANWDPEIWTATMLKEIPMDWYAILDWNISPNMIH